jgi:hypothetical protein
VKSFDFTHSGVLECGEVGTPEVPKARVNRGHPILEDTCQQIMYSGGLALQRKLGVVIQEWRTPEVPKPQSSSGWSITRTHIVIS